MMFDTFHFETPWVLHAVWLVPLLGAGLLALQRRRSRAIDTVVAPARQSRLAPRHVPARDRIQLALVTLGLMLALVAVARPRWGLREAPVLEAGRHIMICLDVSRSMLARDVHPNRLQRAKADLLDFVESLEGDRVGLIAFRGGATVLCPLTRDTRFLIQILEGIDIDSAPPGATDIAAGLTQAIETLEARAAGTRAILLVSDGEALSSDTHATATLARDKGIPIFAVGIGSREGTTVPNGEADVLHFEDAPVITRLDHASLHQLATLTDGIYWPVERASTAGTTLGSLYRRHVQALQTEALATARRELAVERYALFLLAALIVWLLAAGLSPGQPAGAPRSRRGALLIAAVLALLLPASTFARDLADAVAPGGRTAARTAQRLEREHRRLEAAEQYLAAARAAPTADAWRYRLNAALALMAEGDDDGAVGILEGLAPELPEHQALVDAAFGLVRQRQAHMPHDDSPEAAARRQRLLEEAVESFRLALRRVPAPLDRQHLREQLAAALEALPAARRQARLTRLRHDYADTPLDALADDLYHRQRELVAAAADAFSLTEPEHITELERIGRDQRELADLWLPLAERLDETLAPDPDPGAQQLRESLAREALTARAAMQEAATGLRDLDPRGLDRADAGLDQVYDLWRAMAPPSRLLEETMRRQELASAALEQAQPPPSQATREQAAREQVEAARLTQLFRERVAKNTPDSRTARLEPTARNTVLELADATAQVQHEAATALRRNALEAARQHAAAARDGLAAIEALLPEPESDETEPEDSAQDEPDDEPDPESPPPAPDDDPQPPDESSPRPRDQPEAEPDDPLDMEHIQMMLDQALDREQEAAEQRRRQQAPPPAHERDW